MAEILQGDITSEYFRGYPGSGDGRDLPGGHHLQWRWQRSSRGTSPVSISEDTQAVEMAEILQGDITCEYFRGYPGSGDGRDPPGGHHLPSLHSNHHQS
ncbi:hypothetical protein ACOMHN_047317 [Nucella lapillus]